jgi:hypothetical protein
MAATYPNRESEELERSSRPTLTSAPPVERRSRAMWWLVELLVVAAIGVVGYFLLYGGDGGGGAGGGTGGGGYFVLGLPIEGVNETQTLTRRTSEAGRAPFHGPARG